MKKIAFSVQLVWEAMDLKNLFASSVEIWCTVALVGLAYNLYHFKPFLWESVGYYAWYSRTWEDQ